MPISDEQLIAYLLGDASQQDRQCIETALRAEPDIRLRLTELRHVLGQIDALASPIEPPADLVDSTMQFIDRQMSPQVQLPPATLSPAHTVSRRTTTSLNTPALCLSILALCCLILPTVVRARYESRRLQCAENLRIAGQHFTSYAIRDAGGRIPSIPVSGRAAFAGYYTVRLNEAGIPLAPHTLQCSSRIGIDDEPEPTHQLPIVASSADLRQLSQSELSLFQRTAGGDFAYSLGVQNEGKIQAPTLQGQSHLAIMADCPLIEFGREKFVAHAGRGFNILYRDGRVFFVSVKRFQQPTDNTYPQTTVGDYPFRNLLNTHEVGLSLQDASLAPSHYPPIAR